MCSTAVQTCWAKSEDSGQRWMSVPRHLTDAATIAGLLWDEWLPPAVRRRIGRELEEPDSARALTCLLAGLHDLGKISPAFASDVPRLLPAMERAGLAVPDTVRGRRQLLPHAMAGGVALREWLIQTADWSATTADAVAVVIAGHHGAPPDSLSRFVPVELLGEGAWQSARNEMIEEILDLTRARRHLAAWSRRPPDEAAQVLLTATVIVADWLASNTQLFPLDGADVTVRRAKRAWTDLKLPTFWTASLSNVDASEYWEERFSFPEGASPRPVQVAACELVRTTRAAPLLIIEAPMGEGKTEAALAAAELLAARFGAGGLMVALPTMATSDAMFRRVLDWLGRLPPPVEGAPWSTYLAHSKARLNDDFRGLGEGRITGVGVDEQGGAAVAHAWLSGRKKGVLSSFVVGTIDQVLVAALRTRHLALRHLALASKVVVLDEVHAADEYMSVYLDRALAWLGEYEVPTVLLSATLPPRRRAELVAAYLSSRRTSVPAVQSWRRHQTSTAPATAEPCGYPLLTLVDGLDVSHREVGSSGRQLEVSLQRQDEATVLQALVDALSDGGTAAVVCNTVKRAQGFAHELRTVLGGHVLLVHSRFLADDRRLLECQVRDALGPPGSANRPPRFVVVGTQVLEQSLDIDVDIMVSDLAPADLVLQRLGRLHRHARLPHDRPPGLRAPRCLLSGVRDWTAPVPRAVAGSVRVYGEAALLRSATVLRPFLDGAPLRLPDDIAPVVRSAYATYDFAAPEAWWPTELCEAEHEATARREKLAAKAAHFRLRMPDADHPTLLGWLSDGTDEDSATGQAAVRDGLQGVEVLLLEERDGALYLPHWLPRGSALLGDHPSDELARAALGCAVRLPDQCTDAAIDTNLAGPDGWSMHGWLRHVLVLRAQREGDRLRARLREHLLTYDRRDGLTVEKANRP